jgi:hypothetical protein
MENNRKKVFNKVDFFRDSDIMMIDAQISEHFYFYLEKIIDEHIQKEFKKLFPNLNVVRFYTGIFSGGVAYQIILRDITDADEATLKFYMPNLEIGS